MYEYSADDVERKFGNQVCLVETPDVPKDFYFLTRRDSYWFLFGKANNLVGSPRGYGFGKLKFSYHRFFAGYYPTIRDSAHGYGYTLLTRNAENRVYTHGLGNAAYGIFGDCREPNEFLCMLKGTFLKPEYYTSIKENGALSALYRKHNSYFVDLFGNKVAMYNKEGDAIHILLKQQEFEDLLKRNQNYGVRHVIEG